MNGLKIVFFGTPEFSAHVLEYLLKNKVNVVAVVSKPDRPKGRSRTPVPTPVKEITLAQNPPLPLFQPEIVSNPEFGPTLAAFDADLFVVVAYGEIIKQHLLDMPKLGCINLHTSLLPKYRGAAPIQRSIMGGEKETGATVMHMVKKMDAGDIIEQVIVPISEDMTYGELEEQLLIAGQEALLKVLHDFERGIFKRTVQDPEKVTIAPKIELEDCQVFWHKPALELHNLIRGVNPSPGAWCIVNIRGESKRLKINRTKLVEGVNETPGKIFIVNKSLAVACGQEALVLTEIQLEGKRPMSSEEFLRGITVDQISFFNLIP